VVNHPRSADYTILWKQWLNLIEEKPDRFIVGTDSSHHSLESEKTKIKSFWLLLNQLTSDTRKKVATENLLKLIK
jgi:hypothetical protein